MRGGVTLCILAPVKPKQKPKSMYYTIEDENQNTYRNFLFRDAVDASEIVDALEAETGRGYFVNVLTPVEGDEIEMLVSWIKKGQKF